MIPFLPLLMVEPVVRAALLEDLGRAGDLTTDAIVPASAKAKTALVARQRGVVAGLAAAATAFRLVDPGMQVAAPELLLGRVTAGSEPAPADPAG